MKDNVEFRNVMQLLACVAPTVIVASTLLAGTAMADDKFVCGKVGGDLVVGVRSNTPTLDAQNYSSVTTGNVAFQIYEQLVTRDESMRPILQIAESLGESEDGKTLTFKIRRGITFHNGQPLTSADIRASFNRYKALGQDRGNLDPVERFETPDDFTFVITLKQREPIFLESISSITAPIVIIPRSSETAPAQELPPIGTGPYMVTNYVPSSHIQFARFDGYQRDERYTKLDGFGGYKVACLDTMTMRIVSENGARVAGLESGDLGVIEDIPSISVDRIKSNTNLIVTQRDTYWLNIILPNWSAPFTKDLKFRQAVQAALDFSEINDVASDGTWNPNPSIQLPGTQYYTEAGAEYLNQHNIEKAKQLLTESGYNGEKITLMTDQGGYSATYNTALVMNEQLKAAGINSELVVLEYATAVQKSYKGTDDWNFYFTGWTSYTAQGGIQTLRALSEPQPAYVPPGGKTDPEFMAAVNEFRSGVKLEERQAAFAKAQEVAMKDVMVIPTGLIPRFDGNQSNVHGYKPYVRARLSNVWVE